jgi:acyl-coenzyme A synthetase/AMP-(fatty) acid ligase
VSLQSVQQHFARHELAVFKWPERVKIVEHLPRNPLGKVMRGEIARIATEPAHESC